MGALCIQKLMKFSYLFRPQKYNKQALFLHKGMTKQKDCIYLQIISYVTTRVQSVKHDKYPSVGLEKFKNWGHGDTVIFLDAGTGTRVTRHNI